MMAPQGLRPLTGPGSPGEQRHRRAALVVAPATDRPPPAAVRRDLTIPWRCVANCARESFALEETHCRTRGDDDSAVVALLETFGSQRPHSLPPPPAPLPCRRFSRSPQLAASSCVGREPNPQSRSQQQPLPAAAAPSSSSSLPASQSFSHAANFATPTTPSLDPFFSATERKHFDEDTVHPPSDSASLSCPGAKTKSTRLLAPSKVSGGPLRPKAHVRGDMANCAWLWGLLWFVILIFIAWPIGFFCACLWIFVSPFTACISCCADIGNLLQKGFNFPLTSAQNMVALKPLC
ncbi:unnamed protein product [Lampetra fluviatilis]